MDTAAEEAILEALAAHGLVTKTPNTASAPRPAGSPDFLFAATPAPGMALEYVRGTVDFGNTSVSIGELPAGAIPIAVTVLNAESWQTDDEGFDYTTSLVVQLVPNSEGGNPVALGAKADISGFDPNTPIPLDDGTTASFPTLGSRVAVTVEPQHGSAISGRLDVVVTFARLRVG